MRFTGPAFMLTCLMGGALPLAAQVRELTDASDASVLPKIPDLPLPPQAGFAVTIQRTAGVEFLLARTGELQLTDAQVTKLAVIARRAADRHKAMRDSAEAHMQATPRTRRDTTGMTERMQAMRETFNRERDAEHADLRDALAVLNPDQQARAWELATADQPGLPGQVRGGNAIFMQRIGPDGPGVEIRRGFGPDGAESMPTRQPPS